MVRLRDEFSRLVAEVEAGQSTSASPSQLCAVVTRLLDAGGASLVMSQRLVRLPVGCSSAESRTAEEVQASLGSGPCLRAERDARPVLAEQDALEAEWPIYARELTRRTRYRSALCFPLLHDTTGTGEPVVFGALTVYSYSRAFALAADLGTIQAEIVELVAIRLLLHQFARLDEEEVPSEYARRQRVWTAIGMLREASGGASDSDAMALLRGHAFARDLLLGDVAGALVERSISARDVLESRP